VLSLRQDVVTNVTLRQLHAIVRRALCHHEWVSQRSRGRLQMRCVRCEKASVGIPIGPERPVGAGSETDARAAAVEAFELPS
jgi:hypothetical protein